VGDTHTDIHVNIGIDRQSVACARELVKLKMKSLSLLLFSCMCVSRSLVNQSFTCSNFSGICIHQRTCVSICMCVSVCASNCVYVCVCEYVKISLYVCECVCLWLN